MPSPNFIPIQRPQPRAVSDDGAYYGFLRSAEPVGDNSQSGFQLEFEVARGPWVKATFLNDALAEDTFHRSFKIPNDIPDLVFTASFVAAKNLPEELALDNEGQVLENQWYVIELVDSPPGSTVLPTGFPIDGTLFAFPKTLPAKGTGTPGVIQAPARSPKTWIKCRKATTTELKRLAILYVSPKKKLKKKGKQTPLALLKYLERVITAQDRISVGVMDIGQGGCNLMLVNDVPHVYFDVGCATATGNNIASLPVNLVANTDLRIGTIVLSHWDEDHWLLGSRTPELINKTWIVPNQMVGWRTYNTYNALLQNAAASLGVAGTFVTQGRFLLFKSSIMSGSVNVTGIAIAVRISEVPLRYVLLTGDAGFRDFSNLLPAYVTQNLAA
ncbi:MAG: hypothetical protein H7X97_06885, partial [Opitutaceae bacterium]|nr:hypothetical protein [Verrucomicrobiales bacterium]